MLSSSDGFILVDPAKFPTAFVQDVDISITGFMAVAQAPWGLNAVQRKLTRTAWKDKPVRYTLPTQDRMIPPTTQRFMATRAGAKVVELQSSHAAMLSHSKDVAAFIEGVATGGG